MSGNGGLNLKTNIFSRSNLNGSNLTVYGIVENMHVRVIKQNKTAAVSFLIDGVKFSLILTMPLGFSNGDLVRVHYACNAKANILHFEL